MVKIYTKTGDHGQTRIIGKKIVDKNDPRVNAYGTVDELNSWIGFIISGLNDKTNVLYDELTEIQQLLFDAGTDLATLKGDTRHEYIFNNDGTATGWLEKKIDDYTAVAPQVQKFILPGGTQTASALHYARTVTRRAEREIVALQSLDDINPDVLIFINRLSDYFFAAARYANVLEKKEDILYRNSRPVFK
ncbi:cob(I)yrinic acid a,c-diamide adenosyltransferase [Furfurilactobacillus siliginis]|uniref:Corrinoid adenosyltransferase n=1 Tax=Furfurilactobacillus siliginis TaxID=348151 RepID=A0A0R2L3I8_9LACO|nr:cob(I)yrinic acid a,c-diamide adenosyltransferase [Furfurilactobacillus siliginis]KRN96178.1 ATP cob(I)alamin adenosyltransferase [Furfurilactobacillus siliginis]GEK27897.1 ATP:cob(I)alamin adenosyltransferase [Furfurilactobacillus siliginis]